MTFQSNALWPPHLRSVSAYGDCISTDTHATEDYAKIVCSRLQREGFGGQRKVFPLLVWTSAVQQPPVLPEGYTRVKE